MTSARARVCGWVGEWVSKQVTLRNIYLINTQFFQLLRGVFNDDFTNKRLN
jgi:hypothetical protein